MKLQQRAEWPDRLQGLTAQQQNLETEVSDFHPIPPAGLLGADRTSISSFPPLSPQDKLFQN